MRPIIKAFFIFFLVSSCGTNSHNNIVGVYSEKGISGSYTFSHIEGNTYGILILNPDSKIEERKKAYTTGLYNPSERILDLGSFALQFSEDYKEISKIGGSKIKGDKLLYRQ